MAQQNDTPGQSLHILVKTVEKLDDENSTTKIDPSARFTIELENDQAYKKTTVKKGTGEIVTWNEILILNEFDSSKHTKLYLEILDGETADTPVRFAAISITQINDAPGKSYRGKFNVFDALGKDKGVVTTTITIIDTKHVRAKITNDNPEQQGESTIDDELQKRYNIQKPPEAATETAGESGETPAEDGAEEGEGDTAPAPGDDAPTEPVVLAASTVAAGGAAEAADAGDAPTTAAVDTPAVKDEPAAGDAAATAKET